VNVAVVGTGLAAMAAVRALLGRGVRPLVLDVGRELDAPRVQDVRRLAALPPQDWTEQDRGLFANPTVGSWQGKPRKLTFGSAHFYGDPARDLALVASGPAPPFSHARGGLSVGWGASVLPPHDDDLADWPFRSDVLAPYAARVMQQLPYSARHDGLSRHFPILQDAPRALRLSPGNNALLDALERGLATSSSDHVVVGQARVLTRAEPGPGGEPGCRYCGECMSGCVYDAMYSASQTLTALQQQGAILLESGVKVDTLHEDDDGVVIRGMRNDGSPVSMTCDRVFLAAGAVGTTAIVLRSRRLYDRPVRLLSTGGFVLPLWRRRSYPSGWPDTNTQAGVFLEFREPGLSPHWVHTQLSSFNELALAMVGAKVLRPGLLARLKRWLVEHMVAAHANFHSDHANAFVLTLKRGSTEDQLHSRIEDRPDVVVAHRVFQRTLTRLLARCGVHAVPGMVQHGRRGESFHVGGTLPMRTNPSGAFESDCLGRTGGWSRVHVVDSCVFPSLPGTTVGLLAMANAARIASEAPLGAPTSVAVRPPSR
jgi:choline dehydrogenase-like flavoprotein